MLGGRMLIDDLMPTYDAARAEHRIVPGEAERSKRAECLEQRAACILRRAGSSSS